PLAIVNDRVLRAGLGEIYVWERSQLKRHANGGLVGRHLELDEEDEEYFPETERSQGQTFTSILKIEGGMTPSDWTKHPSSSAQLLVGDKNGCLFRSLDLNNGRIVQRFIGHADQVTGKPATHADDPNSFVTAGQDGHVRLWDLPVMTFSGHRGSVNGVAYAMIDGVPTIFSGGEETDVPDRQQFGPRYCVACRAHDLICKYLVPTFGYNLRRRSEFPPGHFEEEYVSDDDDDDANPGSKRWWPTDAAREPNVFGRAWNLAIFMDEYRASCGQGRRQQVDAFVTMTAPTKQMKTEECEIFPKRG
ncbi:16783_t:CDS:2, partial [Acaulospora colombiana]